MSSLQSGAFRIVLIILIEVGDLQLPFRAVGSWTVLTGESGLNRRIHCPLLVVWRCKICFTLLLSCFPHHGAWHLELGAKISHSSLNSILPGYDITATEQQLRRKKKKPTFHHVPASVKCLESKQASEPNANTLSLETIPHESS